jgi:hypothetical protein
MQDHAPHDPHLTLLDIQQPTAFDMLLEPEPGPLCEVPEREWFCAAPATGTSARGWLVCDEHADEPELAAVTS